MTKAVSAQKIGASFPILEQNREDVVRDELGAGIQDRGSDLAVVGHDEHLLVNGSEVAGAGELADEAVCTAGTVSGAQRSRISVGIASSSSVNAAVNSGPSETSLITDITDEYYHYYHS